MRLLIAFSGALFVGAGLLIWIFRRRRRRETIPLGTLPSQAPTAKQSKPTGWLISLITSLAASIISGIVLFIIAPYFAGLLPGLEPRPAILEPPQEVLSDVTSLEAPGTPSLTGPDQEESSDQEGVIPSDLLPIIAEVDESGSELEDPTSSAAGASDVEIEDSPTSGEIEGALIETSEYVARWETGLTNPTEMIVVAGISSGRILVEGASTMNSLALQPAQEPDIPSAAAIGRIRVDGASTSTVISLTSLSAETRTMHLRPLIKGAAVSKVLDLISPDDDSWLTTRNRLLIESARTTQLLELATPRMVDTED